MKLFKYLFVGGAAALVDIGLYTFFAVYLDYNYLLVGLCSFVIATGVNYMLSIRHVFESGTRFTKNKEVLMVFAVTGVGLLINQAILLICVEYVEIGKFIAKIIATGIVFFWNYFIRVFYVFHPVRKKSKGS